MDTKKSPNYRWLRWKEDLVTQLVGWVPGSLGTVLRRFLYPTILGRMGNSVIIKTGIEFEFANRVEVGNKVVLQRDIRIRCRGQNSRVRIGDEVCIDRGVDIKTHISADIEIGEDTYIGPYCCLSGDYIKIGKHCLIASHTGIYANNHNFADSTRLIKEQGANYKGIVIEDDCWLGSGVKIVDGVTIGEGSAIGAGAVVTKNIPPYSIAVGVPAKVISKRGTGDKSVISEAELLTMQFPQNSGETV